MEETELISTIQSHLATALTVPVRTSGMQNERPVPAVILDDWTTTDMNFHNSPLSGEAYGDFDGDGSKDYERYLTFDYETKVEFQVRHHDEVKVSELKDSLKHVIRMIRSDPLDFHNNVKQCRLAGGGKPTYRFIRKAPLMFLFPFPILNRLH